MRHFRGIFIAFLVAGLFCGALVFGAVEWEVQQSLKLDKAPLDVAVSARGAWLFVLTKEGTILVYTLQGDLKDQITVGRHIDGIAAGPREDIILVTNKKEKTVQQIRLDFVYDIPVEGAPFKGPAEAPVVITVFNDFQ